MHDAPTHGLMQTEKLSEQSLEVFWNGRVQLVLPCPQHLIHIAGENQATGLTVRLQERLKPLPKAVPGDGTV